MDHWPKFHVIWPLKRKTGKAVAEGLITHVFAFLRLPRIIQSDNGKEFVNQIVREAIVSWGGDVLFNSGQPRHSHSQGLMEQGNYTLERQISKHCAQLGYDSNSVPWASWLPKIQFTLNTMRSEATKKIAYELASGIRVSTNVFPEASIDGYVVYEELQAG